MSVEQGNGRVDCGSQGVTGTTSPERFRGVRIFDISTLTAPKQIAAFDARRNARSSDWRAFRRGSQSVS